MKQSSMISVQRSVAFAMLALASHMRARVAHAQTRTAREIARVETDFNGDGRRDVLSIRALSPHSIRDTASWCGAGQKDTGRFEIRVSLAGGRTRRTDLNALVGEPSLWFTAGRWPVVAADYNGDGRVDFNLGQYAGCNGWQYTIFTVLSDGRVTILPLPPGAARASDFANSTRALRPVHGGFIADWYDNSRAEMRALYCWNATTRAFTLVRETRVDSISAATPTSSCRRGA